MQRGSPANTCLWIVKYSIKRWSSQRSRTIPLSCVIYCAYKYWLILCVYKTVGGVCYKLYSWGLLRSAASYVLVVQGVFTRRTCPRTNSFEISDVTFPVHGSESAMFHSKKACTLKRWSADHTNVSGVKSANLVYVVYHMGKRHEIGPRTCRTTTRDVKSVLLLLFPGPARSMSGSRTRKESIQLAAQTVSLSFFFFFTAYF